MIRLRTIALGLSAACLFGCSETPPESRYIGADDADESPAPEPDLDHHDRTHAHDHVHDHVHPEGEPFTVAGVRFNAPSAWRAVDPRSAMRKAQFRLEHPDGDDEAEIVFFHFGPGQGGSVEQNLIRWARLVLDEDGQPVPPLIEQTEHDGLRITIATMSGAYLSGPPGGELTPMPDWTLVAAVVEDGPPGSVFPRLVGPSAVVDEHAELFKQVVSAASPQR